MCHLTIYPGQWLIKKQVSLQLPSTITIARNAFLKIIQHLADIPGCLTLVMPTWTNLHFDTSHNEAYIGMRYTNIRAGPFLFLCSFSLLKTLHAIGLYIL